MGGLDQRGRSAWWRRSGAFFVSAAFVAAATCSDQPPVAPRHLSPGVAALSLSPTFAALPPGAPFIPLSRVHAVLTAANGDHLDSEASFVGDSAVLTFQNVPISGASAIFSLSLAAFDTRGAVAYRGQQELTLHAGDNSAAATPLVYDGPDANVATLRINSRSLTLAAAGSTTLAITGSTASGQDVPFIRVGWVSRDTSIATIDETGAVHAGQSQGTTWIVATTANGVRDSIPLKVQAPVAKIVITSAPSLSLLRGNGATVTGELRDATNHLIDDRTITWTSSDPSVVSISATGAVSALKIGKATLTASAEGKTATVPVTVTTAVDHIELTPSTLTFASLTQTASLAYKVVPVAGGSVAGLKPRFTSAATTVVTVDSNGVVTAVGNGPAKIVAELDGVTATTNATVTQVAVSGKISPTILGAPTLGSPSLLTAEFVDALGKKIEKPTVTWSSSDTTIATVTGTSAAGTVIPIRAGNVTITAVSDGKSNTATVIVAPLVAMLLVDVSAPVSVGQGSRLRAQFADAGATPLGDAKASYTSSNPNVAAIVGDSVYGVSPGSAHIIGTSNGFSGAIDITVTAAGSGSDLIVIDDFNAFDSVVGAATGGANQTTFYRNLMNFSGTKPRASGTRLMVYRGNQSLCANSNACGPNELSTMVSTLQGSGYTVTFPDPSAALPSTIDPSIKTILLMTPRATFDAFDLNTLKQFMLEGGRVIFVGDFGGYYGPYAGVENQFLQDLGSTLRTDVSLSSVFSCATGYVIPASSIRPHQITAGLTGLAIPCAAELFLGAKDRPLFYDQSGLHVLAAVATYDPTPISVERVRTRSRSVLPLPKLPAVDGVGKPVKPTGTP